MSAESQPYVGPRPFKREDARLFFGRDREANDLVSLIISHAEVLLYAQSGAGKTSLINAKLWDLLVREGLEVLPVARMQGSPSPVLEMSKIKNIYVFNTLVTWAENTASPLELAEMTLPEMLQKRFSGPDKQHVPFVAVFDQFEELFTAYPECWEQRRAFFVQVREALNAYPQMRALFAMREDYLGAVAPYASIMPEKFRVRFHLENLREPQAIEAVEGPLSKGRPERHFAPGVAKELVEELMKVEVETAGGQTESIVGEFVEPVQLQVVCERLWRDLKEEDTEITAAHLKTISVEKALLSFYEESIKAVAGETKIAEQTLRSWFEKKLVTPAGTRGMAFRGETETEGLPNKAVDALEHLHLIRSELRGGGRQWYELTHDRFIDAIQESRQQLLQTLQTGAVEKRQRLEDKAAAWAKLGRKKTGLLDEVEVQQAQHWLDSPDAVILESSETLMALVAASRAEIQARSARRRAGWMAGLGVLCAVTLLMAILAYLQRQEAYRQSQKAYRQSQEAYRQRIIAETTTKELRKSQELLSEINFARNLAARSLKYRQRDLGLALLLDLEAGRIADEIHPKTRVQEQAKDALIPDIRAALVGGLLFSPHLRTFLTGQSDVISSVAYSSDGNILATASFDGTIILWDAQGFPLGSPLRGHDGAVYGVAFSPDNKTIASCGGDGIVNLWDIARLGTHKTFTVGPDALRQIAFAPDGKTLACGTEAGTVVLLDVTGRGEMVTLPGHTGIVYAVAFSPNGKTFASGGEDKKIIFWNLGSRKPVGSVEDDSEVYSVTFSPDGKTLAAGNRYKEVTLWDVAKRQRSGLPLKGHVNSVFSVAFSPDGKTLVSGSPDKTIRRWDVAKRTPIGDPLIGSGHAVYSVALHPDGKTMASGAEGGVAALWDLKSASVIAQPFGMDRASSVMAVTTDGETIAVADFKGNISVVSPKVFETFNANVKEVWSLAFNPDGTVLASVGDDNTIQLRTWNGKTWNTPPRVLAPPPQQSINRIVFNPIDNKILVSAHEDGSILFWNIESGQPIAAPIKLVANVTALALSADGGKLAVGGNGDIALWDVASSQQLGPTFRGHTNGVLALAFSPDGKLLASGGEDSDVVLWNAETCEFVDLLREHTARVTGVAFSPDGKVLASCSNDKSIILWDVAVGTSIHPLVNEDDVFNVRFLPKGELLSTGGDIIYWDISMESLRNRAEQVAARNLKDEWTRFMEKRPYRPTSIYGSLKEADMLALQNKVEEARTAFRHVVVMAGKTKDAGLNNQVGWYGCLDGFAEIVKPACDRAVQLGKPEDKARFLDSRGLANALTGKFLEAAEDFKAFVDWSRMDEERNSKTGADSRKMAVWKEGRERREAWIPQLLSGHNPFDPDTLKTLRIQDALFDE